METECSVCGGVILSEDGSSLTFHKEWCEQPYREELERYREAKEESYD